MDYFIRRCARRILLAVLAAGVSVSVFAQGISLDLRQVPLGKVLEEITRTTGYRFVYSDSMHGVLTTPVTVKSDGEQLNAVLDTILKGLGVAYKIEGKNVAINLAQNVPANASQNRFNTVSGQVKDACGNPLAGVVVTVKGKQAYAVTDIDGNFTLDKVAPGDDLVFSFVGFKDAAAKAGKGRLDIVMQEDVMLLEDVVVTGYQTISKERATGSFAKISSDELALKPVENISQALVGKVPGMVSSDGRFVIRGVGTMQGQEDIDPLVVIDGFAVQGYASGTDPFDMVNPNDVESVTILKDAAATSIYGARAANGVIVITTKKAKENDRLNINFDARVTVSGKYDLEHYMNFANGETQFEYVQRFADYTNKLNFDPFANPTKPFSFMPEHKELIWQLKHNRISEAEFDAGKAAVLANEGKWVDEYNKYLFRNQLQQQYNLSINGASKKNAYNFSIVYNGERGASIGDTGHRALVTLSDTYKILDNLSLNVGVVVNYRSNTNNGVPVADIVNFTTPFTRLFNEDGSYSYMYDLSDWRGPHQVYEPIYREKYEGKVPVDWSWNPLKDREAHNNRSSVMGTRFQGSVDYQPIDGLNISVKGQYELNRNRSKNEVYENAFAIRENVNRFSVYDSSLNRYVSSFPAGGRITRNGSQYSSYDLRAQIDYNKTIKGKHNITAMIIGEMSASTSDIDPEYTAWGYNPNTNAVLTTPDYLNKHGNIFGYSEFYPFTGMGVLMSREDRFLSAGANFAYSYDNRYTVSASARSDASNFIAEDSRNKMSPFWSVGAGWNIRREKFMKEADWVDNLKLRFSYGTAGVAAGKTSMSTLTTVGTRPGSIINTNNEPYSYISLKGNPSLTWEKSRTINAGVDFSFFRGQLYGSVEYYNRYSYDVLAQASVPFISQSADKLVYNNAAIQNSGVELTLGSAIKIADRIDWKGDFNLSYNKNYVKEFSVVAKRPGGKYVEGRPLSPLYGFTLVGYTPEGILKQQSKDGTVVEIVDRNSAHLYDYLEPGQGADDGLWKTYQGTTIPVVTAGFTNTFNIYGFTLSFMFTGKFGHKIKYNNNASNDKTGVVSFAEDALEMDKNGYSGDKHVYPVFNEQNYKKYNAGSLTGYASMLYMDSNWNFRNASHIRLNSVYLGYRFPAKFFNKVMLDNINIYFEANNLGAVWVANDLGFDPEAMPGTLRPLKNYTFGVKLNF